MMIFEKLLCTMMSQVVLLAYPKNLNILKRNRVTKILLRRLYCHLNCDLCNEIKTTLDKISLGTLNITIIRYKYITKRSNFNIYNQYNFEYIIVPVSTLKFTPGVVVEVAAL